MQLQKTRKIPLNQAQARVIAAAAIGTALEFFDLVVYGFFAVTIAQVFFPADNSWVSLLITTSTFGLSYLIRPLGAIVLGSYADRNGRKAGLVLSVALMAVGTGLIACTPSYESIGIAAPILVVAARFVQGFSAGGEFGAATSFLVEHAPKEQRGFYGSFQMAAQGLTAVLAAGFGAATAAFLSKEHLLSWGWRLPFLFGMLIIPVAIYIRRGVEETPGFKHDNKAGSPVIATFTHNKIGLTLAILTYVLNTASSYVVVLFMPTFAVKKLGLDPTIAFVGTLLLGGIQMIACPFFGAVSDRLGRLPTLAAAAATNAAVALCCFALISSIPTDALFIVVCLLLGVSISAFQGPIPAALSEIFPSGVRSTGLALTHNLAVAAFGGFAPLILAWGIARTGSGLIPGIYMVAASAISLTAIFVLMSFRRSDLSMAAKQAAE